MSRMRSLRKRTAWPWQALCCCLMAAALLWVAMHSYRPRGRAAHLPVPLAAKRAEERMPFLAPSGSIRVNTAQGEELSLLPGVGPVLAEAIIAERETNGPFHFPEDLLSVRGIGQKKLAGFLSQMTLE